MRGSQVQEHCLKELDQVIICLKTQVVVKVGLQALVALEQAQYPKDLGLDQIQSLEFHLDTAW